MTKHTIDVAGGVTENGHFVVDVTIKGVVFRHYVSSLDAAQTLVEGVIEELSTIANSSSCAVFDLSKGAKA